MLTESWIQDFELYVACELLNKSPSTSAVQENVATLFFRDAPETLLYCVNSPDFTSALQ